MLFLRNEQIQADRVLLIMSDGTRDYFSKSEALSKAQALKLDLLQVAPGSPNTEGCPVCKLENYNEIRFKKIKSQKNNKNKSQQTKTVNMRPVTADGDYQTKLKNIQKFLEKGHKVKVVIRFRGREMAHTDLGFAILNRLQEDIADSATIDSEPKLDGRQIILNLAPSRKK